MAKKIQGPKKRPKFKAADQSTSALKSLLQKGSGASQTDVKKAIAELKKRGEDTPPAKMVSGGRRIEGNDVLMNKGGTTKKVPAVAISFGMVDAPKNGKGKAKMMRGGMANGKQHMYSGGGSVTDNPGLKALRASGPKGMEAYKKITGQ